MFDRHKRAFDPKEEVTSLVLIRRLCIWLYFFF